MLYIRCSSHTYEVKRARNCGECKSLDSKRTVKMAHVGRESSDLRVKEFILYQHAKNEKLEHRIGTLLIMEPIMQQQL